MFPCIEIHLDGKKNSFSESEPFLLARCFPKKYLRRPAAAVLNDKTELFEFNQSTFRGEFSRINQVVSQN